MPAYRDKTGKKWICKFYYRDLSGNRHQKWKGGFSTRREAVAYEDEFLENSAGGGEKRFQQVYGEYIEYITEKCKLSTLEVKRSICNNHILPYFANMRLEEISVPVVREWQKQMLRDPRNYSQTYLHMINVQLGAIMRYAGNVYGLIQNPCDCVDNIGSSLAGEMDFWTTHEYKKFRRVVDHPIAFICFEMLYWTGMREGEMLALNLDDINFETREISISKTYRRVGGREYIWEPKNPQSKRRVTMPDFLCDELKTYIGSERDIIRKNSTTESFSSCRLFPVNVPWLNYRIKKYADKAHIKPLVVHGLRHSHVSMLINNGFDALEISKRIGHKKTSMTLDVYSHMFPTKQSEIAKKLNKMGQ